MLGTIARTLMLFLRIQASVKSSAFIPLICKVHVLAAFACFDRNGGRERLILQVEGGGEAFRWSMGWGEGATIIEGIFSSLLMV